MATEEAVFRPLRDFGGWGIKFRNEEWAYTVHGNHGLRLRFHQGKSLLIGSQQPELLRQTIDHARKKAIV